MAEQAPPATPPISKLEYVILWSCLGILLSALVVIPVVLWRVNSAPEHQSISSPLDKNSLLGLPGPTVFYVRLLAFVLMMIVDLETVVEGADRDHFNFGVSGTIIAGVGYVCIALTITQMIFTILTWMGKQRSLAERLYYSLVTIAAAGYLLLLGSLGIIPAWF